MSCSFKFNRGIIPSCRSVSLLGLLMLSGCSFFAGEDEVDQSRLQRNAIWPDRAISTYHCPIVEAGYATAYALPPVLDGKVCGHPAPFAVTGLEGSHPVRFSREAKINCVMLSQLHRFFDQSVQPLAIRHLRQPITVVHVAASYSCRTRNNKPGAKLSEHGKMNAIDISALTLADGTVLSVRKDWHSYGSKAKFLRRFNREACNYFTTVIGPDGDKYHQDHFHLDHARHGRKGHWRSCQ